MSEPRSGSSRRISSEDIAKKMGADLTLNFKNCDVVDEIMKATGGRGVDASIEALGTQATFESALRVLKPGGRFYCLEFSKVREPTLARIYDEYSYRVIPKIGEIVAKDRDSYQYLVESIRKFPSQRDLLKRMETAGFSRCRDENLTFGVVAIHEGSKST